MVRRSAFFILFIHKIIYDTQKALDKIQSFMREMGLEPTRPIGHKILSLACLPISALPRTSRDYTLIMLICQTLILIFLPLFLMSSQKVLNLSQKRDKKTFKFSFLKGFSILEKSI